MQVLKKMVCSLEKKILAAGKSNAAKIWR